jgi:hypothetical protein
MFCIAKQLATPSCSAQRGLHPLCKCDVVHEQLELRSDHSRFACFEDW